MGTCYPTITTKCLSQILASATPIARGINVLTSVNHNYLSGIALHYNRKCNELAMSCIGQFVFLGSL